MPKYRRAACIRQDKRAEDTDNRALATAVRAEETEDFALANREGDVGQRPNRLLRGLPRPAQHAAELLANLVNNHRFARRGCDRKAMRFGFK